MAFTLSGNVITQSGTDANPEGLAAISGVTVIDQGNATTKRIVYDLGTLQLDIAGDLTHDPDVYEIIGNIQNGIQVVTGADYKFGIERTVNGRTTYSKGTGLVSTFQGNFFSQFGIVLSGGAMTWNGGVVRTTGAISHSGCQVVSNSTNSVWQAVGISGQWRSTGVPDFKGITMQGIDADCVLFLLAGFDNLSINFERAFYQTPASGGPTRTIENALFANNQAANDVVTNQSVGTQQTTIIKNPDVVPNLGKLSNDAYADFQVTESLSLNFSDSDGVSAADVVAYVADTDNGARKDATANGQPGGTVTNNYTDDRKYIATSDVGGVANLGDILTLVATHDNLVDGTMNFDWRSNFGNESADFNVFIGGYEYLPSLTRQTLLGNNGVDVIWTLFSDENVTLSRSAALALIGTKFAIDPVTKTVTVTASATLDELYDATKAFKYDGTQTGMETPAVPSLIISASGTRLTGFADWNLVADAGVTLSRGDKFNEFAMTGTGTVTNNGTITVPFRDSDGLRVTVTGLDPEAFGLGWYLRYKLQSNSTYIEIDGTGNTALLLVDDGAYDVEVRAKGYDWTTTTLDTATALSVDVGLRFQAAADATPQILKTFNQGVADIFQFDANLEQISAENTTGEIITAGFAEMYQAFARITHLPDLVWTFENPVRANSTTQSFVIPTGNPTSIFLTEDSNDHVRLTSPVTLEETGEAAYGRVRGNSGGFLVILGSPATAESAGLVDSVIRGLIPSLEAINSGVKRASINVPYQDDLP